MKKTSIEKIEYEMKLSGIRCNQVINYLQELKNSFEEGQISKQDYELELEKELNGRTAHEWIEHYKKHMEICKGLIKKRGMENKNKKLIITIITIITAAIASFFLFSEKTTFIGFVINIFGEYNQLNETLKGILPLILFSKIKK